MYQFKKEVFIMKEFFKKPIANFILVLLFVTIITLMICVHIDRQLLKNEHEVYPLTVKIVVLDEANNKVICKDGAGNIWSFYDIEDWQENDFVSLLMDDNGTKDTIYDDIITMTLYAGNWED